MARTRFVRRYLLNPPLIGAAVSIGISIVLALSAPWPAPQFHDEFSYLLAGDTFAHGRVTNRPHQHWEFFETFQVLSQPTYASKYPPAQGMVLAIGQLLTGEPIVGVWLSTAAACAAVGWMLKGALPRRWATMGAALVAMHPLILEWNWSFWGGSVALGGGALLIGATIRLRWCARASLGIVAGVGMMILANSRPLEGAILSALCVATMIIIFARRGSHRAFVRVAVPMAIVLVANFVWMGYYNWRVTGNPMLMPYALYEKQYAPTRPLAWMPPPTTVPVYRHAPMRDFYLGWELPAYQRQRTPRGFIIALTEKLWMFVQAYGRAPTLAAALLALPWAWRRSWALRWASIASVICVLNTMPVLNFFAHYTSPVAGAIFLVIIVCLFNARRSARGRALIAIVIAGQIGAAIWWCRDRAMRPPSWNDLRQAMIAERAATGRKYLIFVRPGEGYYVHNEWVYNGADIDAQPVVWARDMGPAEDQKLIDDYRQRGEGREVEVLTIGGAGMHVSPYRAP
jgi:hypothetical protein